MFRFKYIVLRLNGFLQFNLYFTEPKITKGFKISLPSTINGRNQGQTETSSDSSTVDGASDNFKLLVNQYFTSRIYLFI